MEIPKVLKCHSYLSLHSRTRMHQPEAVASCRRATLWGRQAFLDPPCGRGVTHSQSRPMIGTLTSNKTITLIMFEWHESKIEFHLLICWSNSSSSAVQSASVDTTDTLTPGKAASSWLRRRRETDLVDPLELSHLLKIYVQKAHLIVMPCDPSDPT